MNTLATHDKCGARCAQPAISVEKLPQELSIQSIIGLDPVYAQELLDMHIAHDGLEVQSHLSCDLVSFI